MVIESATILRNASSSIISAMLPSLLLAYLLLAGCLQTRPLVSPGGVTPAPTHTIPAVSAAVPGTELTQGPLPSPLLMPPNTALPVPAESLAPPPSPTPEPRCRYEKMEAGLSALMYTREHIQESPPAKGSEIDVLLSRPTIELDIILDRALSAEEIAELEAKGMLFSKRLDGTVSMRRLLTGEYISAALIPWQLVCWFSDQEYVRRLSTFFFPGPRKT